LDDGYNDENLPPRPPLQPHRKYQKLLMILGLWLPPTLAMIFVISFELGWRKHQKAIAASLGGSEDYINHGGGVIQANHNVILGYGGHGTVVYEGMLEG
jgi:hypothetical protein